MTILQSDDVHKREKSKCKWVLPTQPSEQPRDQGWVSVGRFGNGHFDLGQSISDRPFFKGGCFGQIFYHKVC